MQSQSFAGSLEASFALRSFTFTGFAIALLWLFSPLGGQSSLRVLSNSNFDIQTQTTVVGVTTDSFDYFGGVSHQVSTPTVINALISSSFLAPDSIMNGPLDTWGNVKIPSSSYLANLEDGNWYDINTASGSHNYTSVIGIPVWGDIEQGTAHFSLSWPIYETDCHRVLPGYTEMEWCQFTLSLGASQDISCQDQYGNVGTCPTTGTITDQCIYNETTRHVMGPVYSGPGILNSDSAWWNDPNLGQLNITSEPQYIGMNYTVVDFHIINNVSYSGSMFTCELRTIHTEAEVTCTDGACHVSSFRKSINPNPDFLNPVCIS